MSCGSFGLARPTRAVLRVHSDEVVVSFKILKRLLSLYLPRSWREQRYRVMSSRVISSRVVSSHVESRHVVSCRVMSSRVMSSRVVSSFVESCRVLCGFDSCRYGPPDDPGRFECRR